MPLRQPAHVKAWHHASMETPCESGPVGTTASPGGAASGLDLRELAALVQEDWRTHRRSIGSAGFHALLVQRLGAWRRHVPLPWRKLLSGVYGVLSTLVRNVYGIDLPDRTSIGRRVFIAHHVGVQVDGHAVIGDDVMIRHNVTIGLGDSRTSLAAPVIGDGVRIGAGAVIVGGVSIGASAIIGPNALVVTDVPPGATVFAPSARQMKPAR